MKNTLVAVMLLAFFGCLTVCQIPYVFAQEEQAAVESMTVSGNLSAVDLEKSTITLAGAIGTDKILSVNDSTTIEKAGQVIKLADLVVGDSITVVYIVNDAGDLIAQNITVE